MYCKDKFLGVHLFIDLELASKFTVELRIQLNCITIPSCVFFRTIFFTKSRNELLRGYHPNFPLLVGYTVEQVGQAGEQVLLAARLAPVREDLLPERPAEVQCLEHRVTVAGVSKLWNETDRTHTLIPEHNNKHADWRRWSETAGNVFAYVDQSEVMLINWELLRADLFLQSGGIGALQQNRWTTVQVFTAAYSWIESLKWLC